VLQINVSGVVVVAVAVASAPCQLPWRLCEWIHDVAAYNLNCNRWRRSTCTCRNMEWIITVIPWPMASFQMTTHASCLDPTYTLISQGLGCTANTTPFSCIIIFWFKEDTAAVVPLLLLLATAATASNATPQSGQAIMDCCCCDCNCCCCSPLKSSENRKTWFCRHVLQ